MVAVALEIEVPADPRLLLLGGSSSSYYGAAPAAAEAGSLEAGGAAGGSLPGLSPSDRRRRRRHAPGFYLEVLQVETAPAPASSAQHPSSSSGASSAQPFQPASPGGLGRGGGAGRLAMPSADGSAPLLSGELAAVESPFGWSDAAGGAGGWASDDGLAGSSGLAAAGGRAGGLYTALLPRTRSLGQLRQAAALAALERRRAAAGGSVGGDASVEEGGRRHMHTRSVMPAMVGAGSTQPQQDASAAAVVPQAGKQPQLASIAATPPSAKPSHRRSASMGASLSSPAGGGGGRRGAGRAGLRSSAVMPEDELEMIGGSGDSQQQLAAASSRGPAAAGASSSSADQLKAAASGLFTAAYAAAAVQASSWTPLRGARPAGMGAAGDVHGHGLFRLRNADPATRAAFGIQRAVAAGGLGPTAIPRRRWACRVSVAQPVAVSSAPARCGGDELLSVTVRNTLREGVGGGEDASEELWLEAPPDIECLPRVAPRAVGSFSSARYSGAVGGAGAALPPARVAAVALGGWSGGSALRLRPGEEQSFVLRVAPAPSPPIALPAAAARGWGPEETFQQQQLASAAAAAAATAGSPGWAAALSRRYAALLRVRCGLAPHCLVYRHPLGGWAPAAAPPLRAVVTPLAPSAGRAWGSSTRGTGSGGSGVAIRVQVTNLGSVPLRLALVWLPASASAAGPAPGAASQLGRLGSLDARRGRPLGELSAGSAAAAQAGGEDGGAELDDVGGANQSAPIAVFELSAFLSAADALGQGPAGGPAAEPPFRPAVWSPARTPLGEVPPGGVAEARCELQPLAAGPALASLAGLRVEDEDSGALYAPAHASHLAAGFCGP